MSSLTDDFRYEPARVIADGNLVVTQGTYYGFGPDPLTGFDVWRVEDGKIVEHWDSLTPVVTDTVSGRTQTDGPTEITDLDKTAEPTSSSSPTSLTRCSSAPTTACSPTTSPPSSTPSTTRKPPTASPASAPPSRSGRTEGKTLAYKKVHQVIAQGDFVFVRSEGDFGVPSIYNDLWRIEDGKIVEHWDVVIPVPATTPPLQRRLLI